jgi:hypothetical protein
MSANLRRQQQVLSVMERIGEKPSADDYEGLSFWAVRPGLTPDFQLGPFT